MKKCAMLLVMSLYAGATMYGSQGEQMKRPPSPRKLTQDCEKKVQIKSEQDMSKGKVFWGQVNMYNDFCKQNQRESQKAAVDVMQWTLEKNPQILSSYKSEFQVRSKKIKHQLDTCCPLYVAACIAYDRSTGDPEWEFFRKVARSDIDNNNRRMNVITCFGIRWNLKSLNWGYNLLEQEALNSVHLVQEMLKVGTDVTYEPKIMKILFETCKSLHERHSQASKNYNSLSETYKQKGKLRFFNRSLYKSANKNLLMAYKASCGIRKMAQITPLLLDAGADLTDVAKLIDEPHFKDTTCLGCQSIVERIKNRGYSLQKPLAPTVSTCPDFLTSEGDRWVVNSSSTTTSAEEQQSSSSSFSSSSSSTTSPSVLDDEDWARYL